MNKKSPEPKYFQRRPFSSISKWFHKNREKQNLKASSKKILSNHVYRFLFAYETLGFNIQVKTYRKPSQISIFRFFPLMRCPSTCRLYFLCFVSSFFDVLKGVGYVGRWRKKQRLMMERESETYFLCGKWHHFMYVLCLRHVFCLGGRVEGALNESCCEERKEAFKIALTGRKRWRFVFFTVRFWAVKDFSRKVIKEPCTQSFTINPKIKDNLHVFYYFYVSLIL